MANTNFRLIAFVINKGKGMDSIYNKSLTTFKRYSLLFEGDCLVTSEFSRHSRSNLPRSSFFLFNS